MTARDTWPDWVLATAQTALAVILAAAWTAFALIAIAALAAHHKDRADDD